MKKRTLQHKILNDIHMHLFEYSLLGLSALLYLVFLSIFRGAQSKQFIVTTVFVLYYIVWGIVHHTRDQSLHLKIILEYIAISSLTLLLLRLLLV